MTEVKKKQKRNRKKAFTEQIHIYMPNYLKDQAQEVADEMGVGLSDLLRSLIIAEVARRTSEQRKVA